MARTCLDRPPETRPKNSAVLSVLTTDGIKEIMSGNATDFLGTDVTGPPPSVDDMTRLVSLDVAGMSEENAMKDSDPMVTASALRAVVQGVEAEIGDRFFLSL